jgi:serine/threonine protein kinase
MVPVRWNALVDLEEILEGNRKSAFLMFILKMLQWDPSKRYSAGELLKDPWLNNIIHD